MLNFNIAILFSFHSLLLLIKGFASAYFLKCIVLSGTPNTKKYMIIFKPLELSILFISIFTFLFEIYFFINFFIYVPLYFYEYLAVFDQIFLTFLVIKLIKNKE